MLSSQSVRFLVNGGVATMIHYGALTFNLHILGVSSAGLANLCAAVVGIIASFLGNRYLVFRSQNDKMLQEASRFVLLYGTIACLHGLVLLIWSDLLEFDYRTGFIFATLMQVCFSYWGNKTLVFE